jgi:hypothetical protein
MKYFLRRCMSPVVAHEPDQPRCPLYGRYQGESGHGSGSPVWSRLTQLGHWRQSCRYVQPSFNSTYGRLRPSA